MKFTESRQVEIPTSVLETDVVGQLVSYGKRYGKPQEPSGVKILSDRLEFRFDYLITKYRMYDNHEITLFGHRRRCRMNAPAVVTNGDTVQVTHTVHIYYSKICECCRCCCCG